jgi:hypothetical protein
MAPLDQQSKGIAVDKQANDDIVHLRRFGETDRLPDQTFNAQFIILCSASHLAEAQRISSLL